MMVSYSKKFWEDTLNLAFMVFFVNKFDYISAAAWVFSGILVRNKDFLRICFADRDTRIGANQIERAQGHYVSHADTWHNSFRFERINIIHSVWYDPW